MEPTGKPLVSAQDRPLECLLGSSRHVPERPVSEIEIKQPETAKMTTYKDDSSAGYDPAPSNTLTAFYEDREMAERAVLRLVDAGIAHDQVRLVDGDDNSDPKAMGFWESIGDFFFPTQDRDAYYEGVRRGGFLVTVTEVSGELADKALDILDDEGSVDIDERAESWRSQGWSPPASQDLPRPSTTEPAIRRFRLWRVSPVRRVKKRRTRSTDRCLISRMKKFNASPNAT